MSFDLAKTLSAAYSKLKTPYKYSAEWDPKDPNPKGPVDCSEFVEWAFYQGGAVVPDGADNQYHVSYPVGKARPGCVGFFKKEGKPCHHVGMVYDSEYVIEARGDPYNAVILRPIEKWEKWNEFSGWREFIVVGKEAA